MSDIAEADYRAITDMAHEMHTRIHYLMARTDGPRDPEWHELYDLMQLANVISNSAGRYADRAQLPPEPVGYRPAEDLNPAERDEAAFWAKRAIR